MTFPRKTSLSILTFVALVFALQYTAGPTWLRLKKTPLGETVDLGTTSPERTLRARTMVPSLPREEMDVHQILDPSGVMNHFYQSLRRTERREAGAVTRVLHFGDSPVTADSITSDARALLQRRFGDAGHGFILIAKPWAWYGHRGVELHASGWRIFPASQRRAQDGVHGLGGVSFEGSPGATSTVRLPDGTHTRMEVEFWKQPSGGTFRLASNEQSIGEVNTEGAVPEPGFADFPIPAGSRHITLTVLSGTVRLFGWSFEKNGPGLIYHSLGLNGGQVQVVLRYFEQHQWTVELQHQHPDLVVINYGTNESVFPEYIEHQYPDELRQVIARVRAAVPEASVLVMSPMDRGERDSAGDIVTVPVLPRIVEIQQQVAAETRCAFFNTFEAMGGAGTMARWYESEPRLVSADFMHPLPAGAAKVGGLLDSALMRGYARFQAGAGGSKEQR